MGTQIDSLEIRISSSAQSAIKNLEKLCGAIDTLEKKVSEVAGTKGFGDFTSSLNGLNAKISFRGIKTELKSVEKELEAVASRAYQTSQKIGDAMKVSTAGLQTPTVDKIAPAMEKVEQSAKTAGSSFRESFSRLPQIINNVSTSLSKLSGAFHHVRKSASDTSRSSIKSFDAMYKSFTRIYRMFRLMIVRMALRSLIKEIQEGFASLAHYSDTFNASMSALSGSVKTLSNSFVAMIAPLINALAPALVYITNLIITVINYINQLFAVLSGGSTWIKAKDAVVDYAKSTEKAGKTTKQVALAIDELNINNQDSNGGGGAEQQKPEDLFETKEVDSQIKKIGKSIKDYFAKLKDAFNQIKEAWKYAWNEIKNLFEDVIRDFIDVLNQPLTLEMFKQILGIISDIGRIVGNLAHQFDLAWNKNKIGKQILEDIRDILKICVDHIRNMTQATVEWSSKLDFYPILKAVDGALKAIKPMADALMGVIEDFYIKVILPLTKWAIETGLPDLLNKISDAIKKVDWEKLRGNFNKIWEALEPFAEKVGQGLINFIGDVADAVAGIINSQFFSDFCDLMADLLKTITTDDIESILRGIASAFLAFKIVEAGSSIALGLASVASSLKTISAIGVVALGVDVVWSESTGQDATLVKLSKSWAKSLAEESEKILPKSMFEDKIADAWNKFDAGKLDSSGLQKQINESSTNLLGGGLMGGKSIWEALFGVDELEAKKKIEDGIKNAFTGKNMWVEAWEGAMVGWEMGWQKVVEWWDKTALVSWWNDDVAPWFTADKWSALFDSVEKGISDGWNTVVDWWNGTGIPAWWENDVLPWFSEEKWEEVASGIQTGIETKWNEFSEWWNETALVTWWEENVMPWFTEEKWTEVAQPITKIVDKLVETINQWKTNITTWWNTYVAPWFTVARWQELGQHMKDGIFGGFKGIVKNIEDVLNAIIEGFENLLNKCLDMVNDFIEEIRDALGMFAPDWLHKIDYKFDFGRVSLPAFEIGGFPEDGLFYANHNELVGQFSNGKTAVANNEQIIEGIRRGVSDANEETNDLLRVIADSLASGGNVTVQIDGRELVTAYDSRKARNGFAF